MCEFILCCSVHDLVHATIIKPHIRQCYTFPDLHRAPVSSQLLTAEYRKIMSRKTDQSPGLKWNHLFLIYHRLCPSMQRFPLTFFRFICSPFCFLSTSSVFAHAKSFSFLMDFLLTDCLFMIRGCS